MRETASGIHIEYAGERRATVYDAHALDIPENCPPEIRAKILERRKKLADATAERIRGSHGK